jgi:hypothetical protein
MARTQLRDGWPDLSDEELLDVRLSDLPLTIEGTLAGRIAQLRAELDARELRFPLHFYLSDEWFTPDGATAIAIPFYLAHARLEKLEDTQMLEVEGGEHEWCMRILRHEAGHAIDNAFRLRRRRQRQHTFGSPSQPYPEFYTPKPYSKSFVLHLDSWYAQSHPDEDFAETFAVWLTPNSEWRQRYAGWRALGKLAFGLYAAPAYLNAYGAPATGDGSGHVLVSMTGDTGDAARDWLAATLPRATRAVRTNGRDAMLALARSGVGLACLARVVGDAEPGLERIVLSPAAPVPTLWLGMHRDSREIPRLRAVVTHLADHFRVLAPRLCPRD